jgi:iron complex transport system substrate-binding protein
VKVARLKIRVKMTLLVMALTLVSGCATQITAVEEISTAQSISITGSALPKVARVVALANGSAEIISAMGYRNILIGRDVASSDLALESVEIVASGHQIIPEKILSLSPDLILIDDATGPKAALDVLKAANIEIVMISQAWTLSEIDRKISEVAFAIGAPESGVLLQEAIAEQSADVASIPANTKIAFLYLRGASAIYLIGGKGSGADSLISAIGAIDVGAQALANPFNPMTSEALARLNPDVFIVMSKGLDSVGGIDGLVQLPGVAQTAAGKNRAVIAVDDSLLLSFGPRTPMLITELAQSVERVLNQ